jgi:hypothetical protein
MGLIVIIYIVSKQFTFQHEIKMQISKLSPSPLLSQYVVVKQTTYFMM